MVLIDSSVLIDFLKHKKNTGVDKFSNILDLNISFGITSNIYQELLQGAADEPEFQTLKKYLNTFTFYSLKDEKESFASAAKIYFRCRQKGFVIKSSIDLLIVQTALEHNLKLLHSDKDFENIQKVITELRFW